jgi:hypothetical protein
MTAAAHRSANVIDLEGDRCQVIGERPALVSPGVYNLIFLHHETMVLSRKSLKLALWFRIVTMGEHYGAKLPRYYNVARIEGKPRRGGGFRVGWSSAFTREYAALFNSLPARTDRIPMSPFEGAEVRGRVRTVTTGWRQKPIPALLQYSVIEELQPVVAPTPAPSPTPAGNPRETA